MAGKRKLVPLALILVLLLIIVMRDEIKAQAATIRISKNAFTMEANHYKTLYIYGTNKKVSWSSSNKTIANVTTGGKVYGKVPGTATIYATVSGKKIACKVTVIKLNSSAVAMGKSITLKVSGTSSKVTWSTSNKNIATISTTGKVTTKAPGKVTIYATVAGKKLSCTVTVVKISSTSITLTKGQSITLKVSGTTGKVSWSTNNSTVTSVSTSGIVKAKSPGLATITGTVLGVKLTSNITVKGPVIAPVITPISIPVKTPTPVPTKVPVTSPTKVPTKAPTIAPTPISLPSLMPTITPQPLLSKKIIGYYAAWSRYSGFTPDKLDASKLTHINYAFADIGGDLKIKLGYPDIDATNINGLNQLKKANPNLRTIISVGGYSWSGRFSDVALTDQSRITFANSCVDFLVYYGFDGIDIDWEYPVSGGLPSNSRRPDDKHNFTLLMKTLRERLDTRGIITGKHYELTFAGAAGAWYLNNIELMQINPYVDFVNIMTYDLHGTWETKTNFNAPLFSDDPSKPNNISVDKSMKEWLQTGIPKSKLIMGVPFYGYIYQSVPNINNGFMQTYSSGASITYQKVVTNYLNAPGYQSYYNINAKVPWLFNGSTFITYENELSMSEKAQYIKNNDLGGAMIWELSQDPNKYLLNTLYQKLR